METKAEASSKLQKKVKCTMVLEMRCRKLAPVGHRGLGPLLGTNLSFTKHKVFYARRSLS